MENYTLTTGNTESRRTGLIVLIIAVGVLILFAMGYGLYGCFTAVTSAQAQSRQLVKTLHSEMNQQAWDEIYTTASKGYQASLSQKKSDLFFSSIARKLGTPGSATLQYTNISTTTNGDFIRSVFQTKFSKAGNARETIVWREGDDGQYRLYDYNINSAALLTQ